MWRPGYLKMVNSSFYGFGFFFFPRFYDALFLSPSRFSPCGFGSWTGEQKLFKSSKKQYIVHILLYICNLDSVLSSAATNR